MLGYAERTSAVLSGLSGDDETALSAAEVAGEHTSNPLLPAAAQPAAGVAAGPTAAGLLPGYAAVQPVAVMAGPAPTPEAGADDPLSPPDSTSPIYRANSVVSHTAAPLRLPPLKRPGDTPMSALTVPNALMGASPSTSRVEAQQQQQQSAAGLPGPSYVSLSRATTQPQPLTPAGPLPSTLGLALGAAPVLAFQPHASTSPLTPASAPAATVASHPAAQHGPASNLAALMGLAASMGVSLELLQAQGSVINGGPAQGSHAPLAQQAEALQNIAAALQAQASVILEQQQQQQQQGQGGAEGRQVLPGATAVPAAASAAPASLLPPAWQRARQDSRTALLQQAQPQTAVLEGSAGGGASLYSLPDLVGASTIQGHPWPLPSPAAAAPACRGGPLGTAPTLVSGVAPGAPRTAASPADLQHVQAAAETRAGGSGEGPSSDQRPGSGTARDGSTSPTGAWAAASRSRLELRPMPAGAGGAPGGMPSTDAAAIGGNLGTEDWPNDGMEVQQAAPAPGALAGTPAAAASGSLGKGTQRQDQQQQLSGGDGMQPGPGSLVGHAGLALGELPPAPHGAASVMATLVSSGQQSDVESEISGMQRAASGPQQQPAMGAEVQSPLPSMQPAAATTNARMGLSLVAATASQPPPRQAAEHAQRSQARPGRSESGQSPPGQGAAGSRLATVETAADDDAAGGSVDMTCPAWRDQQHRPATSAPVAGSAPAGHTPAGLAAEHALPQPHAAQQHGGHAQQHGGLQPASSAPMVLPGQPAELGQPQPAMSVSLSAQCDGPGAPGHFAEHNPGVPQAQSSAFMFRRQHRTSWEVDNMPAEPAAPPVGAPAEGQGEQTVQEGQPSPEEGQGEQAGGSPAVSAGTARGTILAGQAHSILTTAAAGEGEQGEVGEDGEALSPLVVGKALAAHMENSTAGRYKTRYPVGAASPVAAPQAAAPHIPSSPYQLAYATNGAAGTSRRTAPGAVPPVEAMDYSTMAQDVGGPTAGEVPELTLLSGQQPTTTWRQQRQQQGGGALSSDTAGAVLLGAGLGTAEESVQANGEALAEGTGTPCDAAKSPAAAAGTTPEELQNGHAVGLPDGAAGPGAGEGTSQQEAMNYASSIVLGNGVVAGGRDGAAAASAAAGGGSELTSPPSRTTSTLGKRRQQSKRKRGSE
ncbi:hypothetical protein N2152v2_008318 [Parachlorella kessleri]